MSNSTTFSVHHPFPTFEFYGRLNNGQFAQLPLDSSGASIWTGKYTTVVTGASITLTFAGVTTDDVGEFYFKGLSPDPSRSIESDVKQLTVSELKFEYQPQNQIISITGVETLYDVVRGADTAAGTYTLVDAGRPEINGSFTYSESYPLNPAMVAGGPLANGDDNGTVIKSNTSAGWWLRDFTYADTSSGAINLDWYLLEEDGSTNLTVYILPMIIANYCYEVGSLNVYIKSSALYDVVMDPVTFDGGTPIENFHLFSGGGDKEIRPAQPWTSQLQMFYFNSTTANSIKFEAGVTLRGTLAPVGEEIINKPGDALIHLASVVASEFSSHATIIDAPKWAIAVTGPTAGARLDQVTVGGQVVNSGVQINSGVDNMHADNILLQDALGRGMTTASGYEKWHGLWVQYTDLYTGAATFQYGHQNYYMTSGDEIGQGVGDPLVFTVLDHGYMSPENGGGYVPPYLSGAYQAGKINSHRVPTGAGGRYLKIVSDGNPIAAKANQLEATLGSPGASGDFILDGVHIEYENVVQTGSSTIGVMTAAASGTADVANCSYSGTIDNITVYGGTDNTIINATTDHLLLSEPSNLQGTGISGLIVSESQFSNAEIKSGVTTEFDQVHFTAQDTAITVGSTLAHHTDPVSFALNACTAPDGAAVAVAAGNINPNISITINGGDPIGPDDLPVYFPFDVAGYSPEAQAVIDRLEAGGGQPLDDLHKDAIALFVDSQVTSGNWGLIDEFFCFLSTTAAAGHKERCLTGWVGLTAVERTSPTYLTYGAEGLVFSTRAKGDEGLDTLFSPATNAVHMAADNRLLGVKISAASVTASGGLEQYAGLKSIAGFEHSVGYNGGGGQKIHCGLGGPRINETNTRPNSDIPGRLIVAAREAVAVGRIYVDGVDVGGQSSDITPEMPAGTYRIGVCWDEGAGTSNYGTYNHTQQAAVIGAAVGFDHTSFNTALNQLVTDLGGT